MPSERSAAVHSSRADRAQQFMPFAALRGYYDLIRERERKRNTQPRHEVTEEEARELSWKFSQIKRREMVSVTYYDGEAYVTVCGLVSDIDEAARTITIVKTTVNFDDIVRIDCGE